MPFGQEAYDHIGEMNLPGTETRPYPLSRGRADHGVVDIALDPVLRIDKVLERKG